LAVAALLAHHGSLGTARATDQLLNGNIVSCTRLDWRSGTGSFDCASSDPWLLRSVNVAVDALTAIPGWIDVPMLKWLLVAIVVAICTPRAVIATTRRAMRWSGRRSPSTPRTDRLEELERRVRRLEVALNSRC